MMAFLFSRTGGVVVAIIAVLGLLTVSHRFVYQAGQQAEREAMLSRSVEVLRERNRVDDEVRDMDARSVCLAIGGLPDECADLGL